MRFAFLFALNKSRYMQRERPPCALCRPRLHPSICCLPAFPVWSALWFVPYHSISHSSCLIQRLALPCAVWHPFFLPPLSAKDTLSSCAKVQKRGRKVLATLSGFAAITPGCGQDSVSCSAGQMKSSLFILHQTTEELTMTDCNIILIKIL